MVWWYGSTTTATAPVTTTSAQQLDNEDDVVEEHDSWDLCSLSSAGSDWDRCAADGDDDGFERRDVDIDENDDRFADVDDDADVVKLGDDVSGDDWTGCDCGCCDSLSWDDGYNWTSYFEEALREDVADRYVSARCNINACPFFDLSRKFRAIRSVVISSPGHI
jgi:hypothetical protein